MSEPFIQEVSTSSIDYPLVLPATALSASYLFLAFSFTAALLLSTKLAYRTPRPAGHWQLQEHFLPFLPKNTQSCLKHSSAWGHIFGTKIDFSKQTMKAVGSFSGRPVSSTPHSIWKEKKYVTS